MVEKEEKEFELQSNSENPLPSDHSTMSKKTNTDIYTISFAKLDLPNYCIDSKTYKDPDFRFVNKTELYNDLYVSTKNKTEGKNSTPSVSTNKSREDNDNNCLYGKFELLHGKDVLFTHEIHNEVSKLVYGFKKSLIKNTDNNIKKDQDQETKSQSSIKAKRDTNTEIKKIQDSILQEFLRFKRKYNETDDYDLTQLDSFFKTILKISKNCKNVNDLIDFDKRINKKIKDFEVTTEDDSKIVKEIKSFILTCLSKVSLNKNKLE